MSRLTAHQRIHAIRLPPGWNGQRLRVLDIVSRRPTGARHRYSRRSGVGVTMELLPVEKKVLRVIAGLLVLAVVLGLYRYFTEWRAEHSSKEERDSIPLRATTAAAQLVNASKSCQLIDKSGLEACAAAKAELVQETVAVVAASQAIQSRADYYTVCQRHRAYADCHDLLTRAFNIAYRSQ